MPRGARGKGLRAIRHAAFTLGLLAHCRSNRTPHPGFVIFDSLLLAYRESDGKEDDLRGTELKEQFYRYLQELTEDRQVIVVENTDPPAASRRRFDHQQTRSIATRNFAKATGRNWVLFQNPHEFD